jgi:uncharacterized repeat protein (TIGR01451 family)
MTIWRPALRALLVPALLLTGQALGAVPASASPGVDLVATKADEVDPVVVGRAFNYQIIVRNDGDTMATGVEVTDVLPRGMSYLFSTVSCSVAGRTLTCGLPDLTAGADTTLEIRVRATRVGRFTNQASVTSVETDDVPADNATGEGTQVVGCPGYRTVRRNQVVGTSGNNAIRGTGRPDILCGLGGNDRINGLGKNDILLGGAGSDDLFGRGGDDLLKGGAGKDLSKGGSGSDVVRSVGSDDKLLGGTGNDKLSAGAGKDLLRGGGGNDALAGGPGIDTCFQGSGTGPESSCEKPDPTPGGGGGGGCHPSYPDVCIPPPPPDLDCDDVPHTNFRVRGSDPHGFDGDNDGRGCET